MYSGCSFLTKQTFSSKAGQGLERVLKVRPGERHDRCQPDGPHGARAGPSRWAGPRLALESEWSHIQRALLPKAGQNPTDVCVAVLGSGSHVLLSSCSLCFGRKQMAGRVNPKIQPKVEARQAQEPLALQSPSQGLSRWPRGPGGQGQAWKRQAMLTPVTFSLRQVLLLSESQHLVLTMS